MSKTYLNFDRAKCFQSIFMPHHSLVKFKWQEHEMKERRKLIQNQRKLMGKERWGGKAIQCINEQERAELEATLKKKTGIDF